MQITMGEKYQTRGDLEHPSKPVRILCTNFRGGGPTTVIGLIMEQDGRETFEVWTLDGRCHPLEQNRFDDLVPAMEKIDITKHYRTRKGLEVDILKTGMKNPLVQVLGVVTLTDGREMMGSWTEDGRFAPGVTDDFDLFLVPDPEPVVHQMWVVMDDRTDKITFCSHSREEADMRWNPFEHETVRLIQWNTPW